MHKTKRKKEGFLRGVVVLGLICAAFSVSAMIAPQIYFTDGPNLSKNDFNAGEKIEGNVRLSNQSGGAVGDLSFRFLLLQKTGDTNSSIKLVSETDDLEKFDMAAEEVAVRDFSYILPSNLPAGELIFRVQLIAGRGEDLSWSDKKIKIAEAGDFVSLGNGWMLVDGKQLDPAGGIYYNPGDKPAAVFDIVNSGNSDITGFYRITSYVRNSGGKVIDEANGEVMAVKAGEKTGIDVSLPVISEPETYLSKVEFYDEKSKKVISNPIYFRWIISGENAKIMFAATDKEFYRAGEEAEVAIDYTGPADGNVKLGMGSLEAKIFDGGGQEAGEGMKELELNGGHETIKVPIKIDISNPRIEVKIVRDGKILDVYGYQIKTNQESMSGQDVVATPPAGSEKEVNWPIVALAAVVAAVIVALIIRRRGKKNTQIAAVLLAGLGMVFGAGDGQAAIETLNGGPNSESTVIVVSSPERWKTFSPGEYIDFKGTLRVAGCGNALFNNKLTLYLTEDRDMPYIDCRGRTFNSSDLLEDCSCGECRNCYGSKQEPFLATMGVSDCSTVSYYDESLKRTERRFKSGDHVKYLDQSKNYQARKIGTLTWADLYSVGNTVHYEGKFKIPDDINMTGRVRLYAVYSGSHWADHWHWSLFFHEAYLKSAPRGNNDAYTVARGTTLNVAAGNGVLINDYDPDGDTLAAVLLSTSNIKGTLNFNPDGSFSYTPGAASSGNESFTYQAFDGFGKSAPLTVTLSVTNNLPTANPDSYMVDKNSSGLIVGALVGVLVNDNDPNGDALTAVKAEGPANGTLALQSDGSFNYVPKSEYFGSDSFKYYASDGVGNSGVTIVNIQVNNTTGTPVASPDTYVTNRNTVLNVPAPGVLANDMDSDGDPLTAEIISGGELNGTIDFRTNGSFSYTPQTNFTGTATFNYRAKDASKNSTPATVTILVKNDGEPVAELDSYSVLENGELIVTTANGVLANDWDPEGGALTAHKEFGDTANGRLIFNQDGSFIYNPSDGFSGIDSFVYWNEDNNGNKSNEAFVMIKVEDKPMLKAEIECAAGGCAGGACGGDTWVAYRPSSTTPCVFKLNNGSTPPASITQSVWRFDTAGSGNDFSKTFSGAGGYGALQPDIASGNYTVSLTVSDGTQTDSISHGLEVREDISAGFACSFDGVLWGDCDDVLPRGAVEAMVYFRDSSDTLSNYSKPSTGATINSRVWIFNDNVIGEANSIEASANLAKGENTIKLQIRDTNGRSDSKEYGYKQVSIPVWKEVGPTE